MTDPQHPITLEICTGDPLGILAAIEGGADRVELCSGLAEGGLTPPTGVTRFAAKRIATNVLLRPRAGDFVYEPSEIEVMERDAEAAVEAGASGIVIGALTRDGRIDTQACRRLLRKAEGLQNTFHRAFDVVADPFEALEEIIDMGFTRILTSGQQSSAFEGAELIARLHEKAAGRIRIMAGAGVSPSNAIDVLRTSHADDLHASARSYIPPAMNYTGTASMGTADASDGGRLATNPEIVAQLRSAINTYLTES